MNPSQIFSHWIQIAVTALGGWLVLHGSVSPSVAAMVAQIVVGAVLVLGASAFHSLRVWIDMHDPALAPVADEIDAALGQATNQATASVTTSTVSVGTAPAAQPMQVHT